MLNTSTTKCTLVVLSHFIVLVIMDVTTLGGLELADYKM